MPLIVRSHNGAPGTYQFYVVGVGRSFDIGHSGLIVHVFPMTLNISAFVIPESPIGTLAIVAASVAALGGFAYFRQYQNKTGS